MRRIVFSLVLATFAFLPQKVQAQQDAQFTQYMFNTIYYNPAYAGVEGVTRFSAIHRTQWLGFSTSFDGPGGNPQTQVISAVTPLYKLNGGAAVHIVNDNLGPVNNLEVQGSFAYHYQIKSAGKLSIGARFGIYAQTYDFDKHRWRDPNDPLRQEGKESQIRPDLSLGAYFQAEKYYIGASMTHVINSEFDFGIAGQRNALESHLYFTGGYHYDLNYNLRLTPSFFVKTDLNVTSFDLTALATYQQKFWGGLSYRQSESMAVLMGINMLKDNSLRAGYSFDYVIQNRDAKQTTSHEILLSYALPVGVYGEKKIIRTPRFRH